jgi:hypothetical protein
MIIRFVTLFTFLAGCTAIVESPEEETPPADEPAEDSGSGTVNANDPSAELDPNNPVRVLPVRYEAQETGYWCGPAATKMALSARIAPPSQGALAGQLGTTQNGTDWVGQITNVLNTNLRAKWFVTRELPNDPPTPGQRDLLWKDLTRSIDAGFPFVANIVAPASNHPPGYPNRTIYHYFTVAGYNRDTRQVFISDSARFSGYEQYWIPFDQLATLIPPKGYTALAPCTKEVVVGKIAEKYDALGGCNAVIGTPITEERGAPDGVGRYNVFERGSIYWTPTTGAHEVHGRIRDAWAAAGWEAGDLGYPISDEYAVDGGRRSDFEGGSIVWTATTNTTQIVD